MDDTTIPEGTPTDTGDSENLLDIIKEDLGETKNHSQEPELNTSAEVKEDSSEGETETTSPSTSEESSVDSTDDKETDETKTTDEAEAPVTEYDKDLDSWAEKRGLPKLTTDLERKLAQDSRNQQREFASNRDAEKRAQEIAKAIEESAAEMDTPDPSVDPEEYDDEDPVMKRLNQLEAERAAEKQEAQRNNFLMGADASDAEVKEMGEMLKEFASVKDKASHDYFTKNTDKWLALAKARLASQIDSSDIQAEAAQKERERLANIQKAQGPSMSATSTVTASNENENEDLEIIRAGLK